MTEDLTHHIIRRTVATAQPQKIVPFGSRAQGDCRPDSDIFLNLAVLRGSVQLGEPRPKCGEFLREKPANSVLDLFRRTHETELTPPDKPAQPGPESRRIVSRIFSGFGPSRPSPPQTSSTAHGARKPPLGRPGMALYGPNGAVKPLKTRRLQNMEDVV